MNTPTLLDLFRHYRRAGSLRQRADRMRRFSNACHRHRLSSGKVAGDIMLSGITGRPLPDACFLPVK
jgi:hypothetical protein